MCVSERKRECSCVCLCASSSSSSLWCFVCAYCVLGLIYADAHHEIYWKIIWLLLPSLAARLLNVSNKWISSSFRVCLCVCMCWCVYEIFLLLFGWDHLTRSIEMFSHQWFKYVSLAFIFIKSVHLLIMQLNDFRFAIWLLNSSRANYSTPPHILCWFCHFYDWNWICGVWSGTCCIRYFDLLCKLIK